MIATGITLTDREYTVGWDEGEITFKARLDVRPDGHLVRWNGWVCPNFRRAEIDRYIAHVEASDPANLLCRAEWDGDVLVVTDPQYENEIDYEPERLMPGPEGLYSLGSWSWTWYVCPPDADPDDAP